MSKIGLQIYSLGCKVNQYDAAVLRRALEARGFSLSPRPEVVIVNTCSVTKTAIRKDRYLAKSLRRDFPKSLLVVMGCWPETDDRAAEEIPGQRIIFWGVGQTGKLIEKIEEFFPSKSALKADEVLESGLIASSDRSRYFIKVGDGCNQFCSYCIIPFARGRLTSRPHSELIEEIAAATAAGYREIVLSGIHLGRYGEDKKNQEVNLTGLLKQILKIKNLGRVRLSSIEINEVTPELIKLMKAEKKICRHLHISLQSGSDKILKLMNRPYTTKYFLKRVAELRKVLPEIAVTTDIIVGFPGESDLDFQATHDFAAQINFSKIHVFSFSAHEKTKAYKMAGKVSGIKIKERSQKLRELSARLEKTYQKRILGLYKKGGLSLVAEQGGGEKTRLKTEFGFDVYLTQKELRKTPLV